MESLDKLIIEKINIKNAIINKKVVPTGGLNTYADAINKIKLADKHPLNWDGMNYSIDDIKFTTNVIQSIIDYTKLKYAEWDPNTIDASRYFKNDGERRYLLYYCPKIDTSNVTNMDSMFYDCRNLKYVPCLNTSNVTNMDSMFYGCWDLVKVSELDISKVTNMDYMFFDCRNLKEIRFKGGHNGIHFFNTFVGVAKNGKAYFKNDGGDYSDIIAELPSTWTYEYIS